MKEGGRKGSRKSHERKEGKIGGHTLKGGEEGGEGSSMEERKERRRDGEKGHWYSILVLSL